LLDDDLGLVENIECFAIQKFVQQLRIEALAIASLPGAARHDVGRINADSRDPVAQRLGDEGRPVVGSDVHWDASPDEQVRENVDDIHRFRLSAQPDRGAPAADGCMSLR
jgi:hypothetical protein